MLHVVRTDSTECVIQVIKTLPQVVARESAGINEQHYICKLLSRLTPAAISMDHLSDVNAQPVGLPE